jgi:predicted cupin superfamily sugar epimerase
MTAEDIVQHYQLSPHPEGGFYKQTYCSETMIAAGALPKIFKGDRPVSTAIYFLVLKGNFSAFHRLCSDEVWHFYAGGCLHIHIIHTDGRYEWLRLGNNPLNGEVFQAVVPAGCWFACETETGYSFTGCTMAPGFDFADFELAVAENLAAIYPAHTALIKRLCR